MRFTVMLNIPNIKRARADHQLLPAIAVRWSPPGRADCAVQPQGNPILRGRAAAVRGPGQARRPQFALLAATFVVTAGVALSAQVLAPAFRRPAAARRVNQAGGAVMLAAAALLGFAPDEGRP